MRFFASDFFHESSSPGPLKITLGSLRIFRKFAEIFAAQGVDWWVFISAELCETDPSVRQNSRISSLKFSRIFYA